MNSISKRTTYIIYIVCTAAIFLMGSITGVMINTNLAGSFPRPTEFRSAGNYKFINPLLECDFNNDKGFSNLTPFKNDLQKAIDINIAQKDITELGVYFRDLNNGPWIGINYDTKFAPASLLKLPVMMAIYKKSESDPNILTSTLIFEPQLLDPAIPSFQEKSQLIAGESYRIEDLIEAMIVKSDNNAKNILFNSLQTSELSSVFKNLGVDLDMNSTDTDILSVKSYASFFRILYNASYLNRELSEKALSYLSRASFDEGIRAGVPKNLTVSHKFGERSFPNSNIKQLHDCGIVYYPQHPYLICVMSRGTNYQAMADTIKDISRVAYDNVDRQVTEGQFNLPH